MSEKEYRINFDAERFEQALTAFLKIQMERWIKEHGRQFLEIKREPGDES